MLEVVGVDPGEVREGQPDGIGVRHHDDDPLAMAAAIRSTSSTVRSWTSSRLSPPGNRTSRARITAPELGRRSCEIDRPVHSPYPTSITPRPTSTLTARLRERRRGLAASFQRARVDRVDAYPVEPLDQSLGLLPPAIGQVDAGLPSR